MIFREIMHFHFMAIPSIRTPTPGVMKFIFFVDPSLINITIFLMCLKPYPIEDKKIFKEKTSILHSLPKITSSWGRR